MNNENAKMGLPRMTYNYGMLPLTRPDCQEGVALAGEHVLIDFGGVGHGFCRA